MSDQVVGLNLEDVDTLRSNINETLTDQNNEYSDRQPNSNLVFSTPTNFELSPYRLGK